MGRFRLFLSSFLDAVALTIFENLGIVIAIHMAPVAAVDYSWTPQVEPNFSHISENEENELGNSINIEEPLLHPSFEKHSPKQKLMTRDEGFLKYGDFMDSKWLTQFRERHINLQFDQRVRARRGQANDPHSIAERLRREKITERV